MSDWRPIETVPRDGTRVLLLTDETVVLAKWAYTKWYTDNGSVVWDTGFTHWMPVPKPPKKRHVCCSKDGRWICSQDINDTGLLISTNDSWCQINYCPFCGEEA